MRQRRSRSNRGQRSAFPNNSALSQNYSVSQSVSAPQASAQVRRSARPNVSRATNGDVRVTHREYIQDISGSVAFADSQLSCNPGLATTFPWLSKLAAQYESYSFENLSFEFETTSPTTATGTVLLAVDYDASDAAPANKTQIMSYRNCVRSPPWSSCCNSSLREDLHKLKSNFVRSGALAANQDVKLYDVGTFNVATQGQANTNAVGELYVSYDVLLMTPQLDPAANIVSSLFSGTTNAAPFSAKTGSVPATVASTGTTTSVSTWTFTQPYQGLVTAIVVGTTLTSLAWTGTATDNSIGVVIDTAGTAAVAVDIVNAQIGDTLILTIANASISAASCRMGEYLYSLG